LQNTGVLELEQIPISLHRYLHVMAGHSRPKDGVASLAYVPAIHALLCGEAWMPGTRPGMTTDDSVRTEHALGA
jgi:hypothetical protein